MAIAAKKKRWAGDPLRAAGVDRIKRFSEGMIGEGAVIHLEKLNGWKWFSTDPLPTDRAIWVITEYQRRCIVRNGIFIRWAICDERYLFWHPMKIDECGLDIFSPPDFPTDWAVSYE